MSVKKKKISAPDNKETGQQIDPAALAQLVYQTRDLLAFHLELGIAAYPATSELRHFLVQEQPAAAGSSSMSYQKTPDKESAPALPKFSESTARQMETISSQLTDCSKCRSAAGPAAPGQGSMEPRLFVVADYLTGTDAARGMIWDAQEGELFWKMMSAIGLDQESVYVTNCIKCRQDRSSLPDATRSQRCFSFLEQELAVIQPELICSMGEIATAQLLGSRVPLIRMRGHFHQYRYPHGNVARVMPTFHPRFLLLHPEMKRATWMDLQAIERQL